MMKYVNVAIDNNNDNTDVLYTYGCELDAVKVGDKVKVPFARGNRLKDAYVFSVSDEVSEDIKGLKYVDYIDEEIKLSEEMIRTCEWMRGRYLCRYIDGIKCFTPAGTVSKRGKKRIPYKNIELYNDNINELTEEQEKALGETEPYIQQKKHHIFLIHGVTGSGKTELYIRMIKKVLEQGRNAVVLVPEIALTTQVIERFISKFGHDKIAVLHSRLSLGERYDEWTRIRNGEVRIVIGARSAVFAPLTDIGIVIMDEEHESTYKSDMAPKYETVEVAIKRAKSYGGLVVLGSATPSVVSTHRADIGIYTKLEMKKRYNSMPLPKLEIVDMRAELKEGNRSIFSRRMFDEMEACLKEKQQVILFLNRRGYSTFVSCRECGYVVVCPECGISLTYHKSENSVVCHFCGKRAPLPEICPECASKYIRYFGTGTEKVEEFTEEMFPEYTSARLDLDTVKQKGSIEKLLNSFRRGKTQILIGTQLVAKGLDFKNVGLVGVISADVSLNIPDYRSAERTFQLITQAAGRAGRGDKEGKVIIQTYSPEHYSIQAATAQDYSMLYRTELLVRESLVYPPFSDIVQVIIIAKREQVCKTAAAAVAIELKKLLGADLRDYLFEPQPLLVNHQKEHYRYGILIKCPKGRRGKCLSVIERIKRTVNTDRKQNFTIAADINPY